MSTNAITPPATASKPATRKVAAGSQDSAPTDAPDGFLAVLLGLGTDSGDSSPTLTAAMDTSIGVGDGLPAADPDTTSAMEGGNLMAAPDATGLAMWWSQAVVPPAMTTTSLGATTPSMAASSVKWDANGTVRAGENGGGPAPANVTQDPSNGPTGTAPVTEMTMMAAGSTVAAPTLPVTDQTAPVHGGRPHPLASIDPLKTSTPTTAPTGLAGEASNNTSTDKPLDKPFQVDLPAAPDTWHGLRHATHAAADTPAVHRGNLSSLPDSPAFQSELVSEVRFLLKGGLQQAELRMNPEELGPIQIDLSVRNQVADIGFNAANAATREGIAQSLPQLKEMLGQQGLSLGQTSVGSQASGQHQAHQQQAPSVPRALPTDGPGPSVAPSLRLVTAPTQRPGGLDLYA